MRLGVIILMFAALAQAETPPPVPTPANAPLTLDRLFQSVRNKVSNWAGQPPGKASEEEAPSQFPEPDPIPAATTASGAASALSAITTLKPQSPVPVSVSKGAAQAAAGAVETKVVFDDKQPKKKSVEAGQYDRLGEGGARHQGPPTKNSGQRAKPVAFDKWYPLCLFFDGTGGDPNQITKDLTDMAAKCNVNLITYPVFVSGANGGVGTLKQNAKSKCNATDGFGRFGVNRGSVILVTGNPSTRLSLCNAPGANPKDIPACGEMGWDVGDSLESRMRNTGRWAGKADGMAFGVAGGSSADVAAALGQTELGLPPGTGAGNGTGEDFEGYASAGSNPQPGWSDVGCEKMRESAFDNDGRWKYLEDREYYALPPKTGKFYDLGGGKPLFNKPNPAPPGGAVAGKSGGGGAGAGAGDPSGLAASAARTAGGSRAPAASNPDIGATAMLGNGGGHKQEAKSAGTSGGFGPPAPIESGRRELEDGSTVRNRLLVTDSPGGSEGDGGGSRSGARPRAEDDSRDTGSTIVFEDGTRRPASVQAGSYGTEGGTQVGGQLLSAGGASALPSQVTGDLPADGENQGGPEKEDGSKSNKRDTVAARAGAAIESVLNGDYFKKIFKQRDGESEGSTRHPRTIQ